MPRYNVYAPFVATKFLGEFEADTPDAAIKAALQSEGSDDVGLCHQCAGKVGEGRLEIDEAKAVAEIVE